MNLANWEWQCLFKRTTGARGSSLMQRRGTALIKKENKIFLIYKEIQMGSGAKSYMRKGFLIYVHHIWGGRYLTLHPIPLNFLIYEENFIFFFISVLTNERCSYDNTITAIQNHLLQADTYTCKTRLYSEKEHCTVHKHKNRLLLEHSIKFPFVYSRCNVYTILYNAFVVTLMACKI